MSKKVKVIPCSGMGKVYGLMARETALKVVSELCPEEAETICLAYVVTGDAEAREKIEGFRCITLDGCPKLCAAKNVPLAGGIVAKELRMVDVAKEFKGAKPGDATSLTEEGWQMVDHIAEMVVGLVKEIGKEA